MTPHNLDTACSILPMYFYHSISCFSLKNFPVIECGTSVASQIAVSAPRSRESGAVLPPISVRTQPGNCSCGKELKGFHVLKVDGEDALLCTCGLDCTCKLSETDPTKCGCGEPIKRVSLKGTGIYFCNCGGSCTCNTFKDEPGECKCGMALKRLD